MSQVRFLSLSRNALHSLDRPNQSKTLSQRLDGQNRDCQTQMGDGIQRLSRLS